MLQAETCGTNIRSHKKAGHCVDPEDLHYVEQSLGFVTYTYKGKDRTSSPVPIVYGSRDGKKWSLMVNFDEVVLNETFTFNVSDALSDGLLKQVVLAVKEEGGKDEDEEAPPVTVEAASSKRKKL